MKVIVLAAGKSERFKSNRQKSLHDLLGKSILQRLLETLFELDPEQIILVVRHQKEALKDEAQRVCSINKSFELSKLKFVEQKEQLGTAHALQASLSEYTEGNNVKNKAGFLVLCVDTPLVKASTFNSLIEKVTLANSKIGVLTAELDEPFDYGRIIRKANKIEKIIEEKDATDEQKNIKEINSGVYFFNLSEEELKIALNEVGNKNQKGEYYLTDLIEMFASKNEEITIHKTIDSDEIIGINSKIELTKATRILNERTINSLQSNGVFFLNPKSCIVSPETKIERDTTVYQNCTILGNTQIGENCQIGPNTWIEDSEIGANVKIKFSCLSNCKISNNCPVGPFANLRMGTIMLDNALVGDFVEIKNSQIGSNSFVSHLSYIGDSTLGADVNIGAGTITANFNAVTGEKTKTIIGNDVKVGSNSVFIAPVEIANGCMIAAGTVVTNDVIQENSLIISRGKQIIKENWVLKKKTSNVDISKM